MAKINKADHAEILRLVDVENRKVAEVAADYGCTPANIYTLLVKLRRARGREPVADTPDVEPPPAETTPANPPEITNRQAGLFAEPPAPTAKPAEKVAAAPAPIKPKPQQSRPPAAASPAPTAATVTDLPRKGTGRGGVGGALAKPGFGLVMRTADGEDSMTPFRSLEDLLSAIKTILRGAARSPDAVWFSIQQIDLASLDSDAA